MLKPRKHTCKSCKKTFFRSQLKAKYCSQKCMGKGYTTGSFIKCKSCPKKVFHQLYMGKHIGVYCSEKCMARGMVGKKFHLGFKHSIKSRKKMGIKGRIGEKGTNWKGGTIHAGGGYIKVYSPKHPLNRQGYVFQHRLIMEKSIGRYLKKEEVVHHINEIPNDNRIENLILFPNNGAHRKFHMLKKH